MDTKTQIKAFIKANSPVVIYHNNENGDWVWAVAVKGTDFWLSAFRTKKRAVKYCKRMGLKI